MKNRTADAPTPPSETRIRQARLLADELRSDAADLDATARRWERFAAATQALQDEHATAAETPRCSCEWADESWHDAIVAIESAGPYWALDLTACMVRAVEGGVVNNEGIPPNDFEQFVTEHNWQDPGAMSHLASNLQFLFTAVLGVGR